MAVAFSSCFEVNMEVNDCQDREKEVTFLFGDERESDIRIIANKFLLCLRSPVFKAMFNGCFDESASNEIFVPDVTFQAFRDLKKFIYEGKLCLYFPTVTHCLNLLYAAEKYQIPEVKLLVFEHLKTREVTVDNFWSLLTIIRDFSSGYSAETEYLRRNLRKFRNDNVQFLIHHAEFFSLNYDSMLKFVINCANVIDEVVLFSRILEWAKDECCRREMKSNPENVRKVLNDIIFFIPFGLMTYKDFIEGAVESQILTSEEITLFADLIFWKNRIIPHPWSLAFLQANSKELRTNVEIELKHSEKSSTTKNWENIFIVSKQTVVIQSITFLGLSTSFKISFINCPTNKIIASAILEDKECCLKGPLTLFPYVPYQISFTADGETEMTTSFASDCFKHNDEIFLLICSETDLKQEDRNWDKNTWQNIFQMLNSDENEEDKYYLGVHSRACLRSIELFIPQDS